MSKSQVYAAVAVVAGVLTLAMAALTGTNAMAMQSGPGATPTEYAGYLGLPALGTILSTLITVGAGVMSWVNRNQGTIDAVITSEMLRQILEKLGIGGGGGSVPTPPGPVPPMPPTPSPFDPTSVYAVTLQAMEAGHQLAVFAAVVTFFVQRRDAKGLKLANSLMSSQAEEKAVDRGL